MQGWIGILREWENKVEIGPLNLKLGGFYKKEDLALLPKSHYLVDIDPIWTQFNSASKYQQTVIIK